jgi:outer membrane usher protein
MYSRGDFSSRYDLQSHLLTVEAGELPLKSVSIGGYGKILGVSLSKNFNLDPFFRTSSPISTSGIAKTPSTLEVYIDNRLVDRKKIPPGFFNLNDLPVNYGKGEIKLVLIDLYGEKTVIKSPIYSSANTLKKGVGEYAYNLGLLGEYENNHYNDFVFSGYHKYGLNNYFTVGAWTNILETGDYNVGFLSAWKLGESGEMSLDSGLSNINGRTGVTFQTSFNWFFDTDISIFGSSTINLFDYGSALNSDKHTDPESLSNYLGINYSVTPNDSLYLSLVHTDYFEKQYSDQNEFFFSYRKIFNHSLYGNFDIRHERNNNDWDISVSFSYQFNTKSFYTSHSVNSKNKTNMDFSFNSHSPEKDHLNYDLLISKKSDDTKGIVVNTTYEDNYREYSFTGDIENDDELSMDFRISGGVVFLKNSIFQSKTISDSICLVNTGGEPGVSVKHYGREIGKTDNKGNFVLTDLYPYLPNNISIGTDNVSINKFFTESSKTITPSYQSAYSVSFPVQTLKIVEGFIYFIDETGEKKPAELAKLVIDLKDRKFRTFVGEKGFFSIYNIQTGKYKATVTFNNTSYDFFIEIPETDSMELKLQDIIIRSGS